MLGYPRLGLVLAKLLLAGWSARRLFPELAPGVCIRCSGQGQMPTSPFFFLPSKSSQGLYTEQNVPWELSDSFACPCMATLALPGWQAICGKEETSSQEPQLGGRGEREAERSDSDFRRLDPSPSTHSWRSSGTTVATEPAATGRAQRNLQDQIGAPRLDLQTVSRYFTFCFAVS